MKFITTIILSLLLSATAYGVENDSIKKRPVIGNFSLEAGVNTSRILQTNSFLKNYGGNEVIVAPDVRAGFSFSPDSRYGRLYPNVRQGIGVTVNPILPHSTLGCPTNIYLYQRVKITGDNWAWIEGEWNFGVSAGWSKYDPASEIVNNAIGSRVNALLGVGLSIVCRATDRWGLKATLNAAHYSNGNTHLPNSGVNTVGVTVGAQYYFDPQPEKTAVVTHEVFKRGFSYDLTAYGATRRRIGIDGLDEPTVLKGSFGVAGLNFAAMYDLNRYFRAGLSADFQYDESANLTNYRVEGTYGEDLKFYRPPFAEGFAAGLSLRAELTLPIFSVNVGLGRNIIAKGPDTKIFYQTLALKAYVWQGAFLQVGYQLCDFHLPNNLMLGFGYTFGKK